MRRYRLAWNVTAVLAAASLIVESLEESADVVGGGGVGVWLPGGDTREVFGVVGLGYDQRG